MSAMLAAMLEAEFGDDGFEDLRAVLPSNPGGRYGPFSTRALGGVKYLAIHHTAGARARPWAAIAREHILPLDEGGRIEAAGIGYHIGIQTGIVALFGDLETSRANVKYQNHVVIGIVVAGDYTRDELTAEDLDALRRTIAVVDAYLGRELEILGHGQVPGGPATACPGAALLAVIPALRQVPAPAPPRVNEAEFALLRRIRDGLAGREVIALNPAAGLQRAIRRAGYVPTTPEWSELDGGLEVVCQGAATVDNNGRVRRRVYFVTKPKWESIRYVEA